MAEVKWIKITTDMFDNRKIKHLRRMPDGDSLVLIWIMLLTMAGRCNAGGMIFLTENIPYTYKMLADELDFEETTVELALRAMESLQMISVSDGGFFAITGWEEYQNTDKMAEIREQNRLRQAKFKEKKKAISSNNVTVTLPITLGNATDIDIEEDKDKEIDKDKELSSKEIVKRVRFAPPTPEEVKAYCDECGYALDAQAFVDYYAKQGWKLANGNPCKDWKACVRTWVRRDAERAQRPPAPPRRNDPPPVHQAVAEDVERNKRFLAKFRALDDEEPTKRR